MVTRIDGERHVIFKLRDLSVDAEPMVHFNKMKKR
jgi:hypothetical protein